MPTFDPAQPFTVAQARAASVSPSMLRRRDFQRVMHGVFVASDQPIDLEVRAKAAMLLHPASARISHTTAAQLLGLPVPHDSDIHLTVLHPSQRRARPGVLAHTGSPAATGLVRGVPVTTGADLFVELSGLLGFLDLVVAGDAMVKDGLTKLPDLRARLAEHRGSGVRRARQAVAMVRARVESPMESRVRVLMALAGFPEPEINHQLRHGATHYRPDLCWLRLQLALEYDGQHHRSDLDQWDSDIMRREWFQARGWRVITLVARDVYQRPERTVERVYEAWRSAGGPPFRLDDQWRRHFPGRHSA